MENSKVQVTDLHKYYGKLEVLKGIDMTVKQGEVVSLIGPSGSGKSTFLRCINLLETPTKGSIVDVYKRQVHMYTPHFYLRLVYHVIA